MSLLKNYVKNYLLEATPTIAFPAKETTGEFQHKRAYSYNLDMTSLNDEQALLKVLENVGDNCFISFVNKYDEKIPRLEVSPKVSYDTPHGNYAYPLTINSLKDIIERGRIGGSTFALERPYFHLFKKSNNINSITIRKNGRNDYRGNLNKDLRTIVHTAIVFSSSLELEKNNNLNNDDNDDLKEVKLQIKELLRNINTESTEKFRNGFRKTCVLLSQILKINDIIPIEVISEVVDFFVYIIKRRANSTRNRFYDYKSQKIISRFHVLYYACFVFSNIITEQDIYSDFDPDMANEPQKGTVFTMLLNSIDIDFINDLGSSTLHSNEPIQAVYLNSSKKESVVLIGTFDNIFTTRKINSIDDLFTAYHNSNSSSNKGPTMNKVVDIIERNPQLQDLFGTALFDDVKLEHALEDLREKAYADLTKKKLVFVKFLRFHSVNKVFDLNIYVGKNKLIVFDIGFKGSFLKKDINKKISIIKDKIPLMLEIENNIDYLQVFLRKYHKKNVYVIRGMSALSNMTKTLDEIQDYTASIEVNSEEDKELIVLLKTFAYFAEDVVNLASIAHDSSLHND
tara:strand:- start:1999 stop:3705 length:1707 start_codon:yes stop_codon:yes gene_type:complete